MGSYLYDGSFSGLLTIFALLRRQRLQATAIHRREPEQVGLFCRAEPVATDEEEAEWLLREVDARMSPASASYLWHAFLSEAAGVEMLLLRYLELGWRVGRRLDSLLSHPAVLPVQGLARKVRGEAHRFKGFVRFGELEKDLYYAMIEPEYRVLPLLTDFFSARFACQNWIIHDLRRSEAIVYSRERVEWRLLELEVTDKPIYSRLEEDFRRLWQGYFSNLAIKERHNPLLQRNKVPLRYRRNLTEFVAG
jgi:probable DNA metabolism protein